MNCSASGPRPRRKAGELQGGGRRGPAFELQEPRHEVRGDDSGLRHGRAGQLLPLLLTKT